MQETHEVIHIEWDGPFPYENLKELNNDAYDYGIYQIYGSHPIYGSGVLLYIGKAEAQTFATRLSQETWNIFNQDAGRIEIYIGRLSGKETPSPEKWNEQISLAEKLLIYSHTPACNTQNLNSIPEQKCRHLHILNWGKHRDLMPEVSGARYSEIYSEIENYESYGNHVLSTPQNS